MAKKKSKLTNNVLANVSKHMSLLEEKENMNDKSEGDIYYYGSNTGEMTKGNRAGKGTKTLRKSIQSKKNTNERASRINEKMKEWKEREMLKEELKMRKKIKNTFKD